MSRSLGLMTSAHEFKATRVGLCTDRQRQEDEKVTRKGGSSGYPVTKGAVADYSGLKSYVATRATLVVKELRHKIHHNLGNWEILKAFEFL